MKDLARHIEWLLHDNDCVILPGFGGFIARVVPAYYVSTENLYYPPSRSISFNTSITMNDGLLAQSYMRSYNIDYAQATYLVDMAIEKLRDTLDEEGYVTIPHIGTIKQDIYQSIQFIAESTGISSSHHFGLGAFTINTIDQLQNLSGGIEQQPKSIFTQTEKTINVHIQKRALRQILSTAAVFFLLLMIALPAGDLKPTDVASLHLTDLIYGTKTGNTESPISLSIDTITEYLEESGTVIDIDSIATLEVSDDVKNEDISENIGNKSLPENTENKGVTENTIGEEMLEEQNAKMPQEIQESFVTSEVPATSETTEPIVVSNNIEITESATVLNEVSESATTTNNIKVTETVRPSSSNKIYHIIVASLPNHRGAEEIIESYIAKGYLNASLVERDNRVRISLAQFTDKNEANSYLKTLREDESFRNAWLLPVHK